MLAFVLLFLASTELLQRGLTALQHGELALARQAFEQVTKQEPRNAFAWASLAETYSRLKQPAAAAAAAAKAEEFGAGNPAISHALAMYFAGTGQLGKAAQLEQEFAETGHADPEAEQRAANLFLEAGDVPQALSAAEKAAAQHPSPAAENILGRALLASGQTGEGEKRLAAAWEAVNTDSRLAFDYSALLLRKQDFGKAAEVLSTALAAHPDDAQLVLALGVVRYGQRRFDDAITAFLRVIQIDSQVEQPYVFLGKMLDQAGDRIPQITAACERWSARNPRSAVAFLVLAKARLASDARDEAAEGCCAGQSQSMGGIGKRTISSELFSKRNGIGPPPKQSCSARPTWP